MALLPTTTTLPGLLTKTSWFVIVFQTIRLSTCKSNSQATTNCSAYGKQVQKLHTSKVKHTQTEQSERRENRYQTHNNESRNEYSHIQSISTNYAKITRYSVSKKQGMNNKLNTEHRKRKLKQRHVIY